MLSSLISESGLKHAGTGNATTWGEDSQRHIFKIICDGFYRQFLLRAVTLQCHCCANAAWHRDQGTWGQRQGCVNIWTSGWGSHLAGETLGFPPTLDIDNKLLCPAAQVKTLHSRKQKYLMYSELCWEVENDGRNTVPLRKLANVVPFSF